ncbi:MAG: MFS transporter [Gammaproteobacteria bacterium]|nr:MFS transporter [Gammaproteobacteria bacterium]
MPTNIKEWNVEDPKFWDSTGRKIANRNLWISIPSLLCGFAVWLMWSMITVQMLNAGFPFKPEQLFTLAAIAGLTGATLRIPSSFFIRIAGGRNTIVFTTFLLVIPALGTGIALQDQSTPLWVFQVLAFLSGFGGGNFASSMSNISFFFPKRMQGLALGLNAGLGNFGVTTMQILIPLMMTVGAFGVLGGDPITLVKDSGWILGKIPAGTPTFIQNAGFVWLLLLIPLAVIGWFGMNNLHTEEVTPNPGSPLGAMSKISGMLLIGFLTAAAGLYIILPAPAGLGAPSWAKWFVLAGIIVATVFLMKLIPGAIKPNLQRQFKIFGNKHTWVMSIIYTMTFGSFIGYSAAFALAIKVIFGFTHVMGPEGVMVHTAVNPNGPSALTYAWMGPFIGALIRPLGGWVADKVGGAKVTQYITIVMVAAALGVAYYMKAAYQSATPEEFFMPFFLLFLVLFAASGIGNGSTFRTIAMVFPKEQAGPALGWTSAVAAYGAFVIPQVFGEQIKATTPEYALYGFALFYFICLVLNWWYYLGPKAEFKNP